MNIRCGTYHIIIYDKVKDGLKPTSQSIEDKVSKKQKELLKVLKSNYRNLEIFRLEVRLHSKTHINSLFRELGFELNPTFKDIMNPKLSQAVLKHFWEIITPSKTDYILKNASEDTYKTVANYIISSHIKMRPDTAMALALYYHHSRKFGIRNTQEIFEKLYTPRTWYRYSKKFLAIISEMTDNLNPYSWVNEIEKGLNEYKPFRLEEVVKSFDYAKQSN